MKKILVNRSDGGITILIPTHEATDELMLRDALAIDGYVSHREVEDEEIPTFRDFRNAWIDGGKEISHDITKANEIKREQLRVIREPLLADLDVKYMKADEQADAATKVDIAAQKQALRDVTDFADIQDINELKSYMPEILTSK